MNKPKRTIPYVEDPTTGKIRVSPEHESNLLEAASYYKPVGKIRTKADLVKAMLHAWIGSSMKKMREDAETAVKTIEAIPETDAGLDLLSRIDTAYERENPSLRAKAKAEHIKEHPELYMTVIDGGK